MKEYIADRKLAKELYKRTRKLYKRYKYGTAMMWCMLLCMVVLNLWMIQRTESMEHITAALLLGLGPDVILIIAAVLARAAAVSGGREVLMGRAAERCFFLDQSFVLEYVPNVHETTVYESVRFDMKYEDIERIVEEEKFGRLTIYGAYKVSKYRMKDSEKGMDSYIVLDMPLYVYGYYREFSEVKNMLLHQLAQHEGNMED